MSDMSVDQDDTARVELALWREHASELADAWADCCYNCSACVSECLAAKYGSNFNPRQIVLKVRYGLAGQLLTEHSLLWQCFRCRSCYERCPADLKPVDVIAALRKILAEVVHAEHAAASVGRNDSGQPSLLPSN